MTGESRAIDSGKAAAGFAKVGPAWRPAVLRAFQKGCRALRSAWGLSLAILATAWLLDRANVGGLVKGAIASLAGTAPYIVIAVLLIAIMKAAQAEASVAKVFTGREFRMVVLAALVGGLAPFCSCEVIPFVAALLAAGTPLPAVMAFWLSSPLIDPSALMITASALGWKFAVAKTIAAVSIGLIGGFATSAILRAGGLRNPLQKGGPISCSSCGPQLPGHVQWVFWREKRRLDTFFSATKENGLFLLKWMTLAYILEAVMVQYVPASLIGGVLGGEGLQPIVLGALVGAPAYLNGYAAPALVAGLMTQGMSAGAAMSFMVAGGISSIPAMVAVWSLTRASVFATYLGLGISGAILIGTVFGAVA